jgi:hypothetical protein
MVASLRLSEIIISVEDSDAYKEIPDRDRVLVPAALAMNPTENKAPDPLTPPDLGVLMLAI